MKILHVSTSDRDGGAARAALRLHQAQRRQGLESSMLVVHRRERDAHIHVPLNRRQRALQRVRHIAATEWARLQRSPTNQITRSISRFSSGVGDWINASDADVVNLHWVCGEMLSIEEIGRIRKPLCWTLHDMWPFCGAEHYEDIAHPGRYAAGYRRDNRPAGDSGPDLDRSTWLRKLRAWKHQRFHLICPSQWMADCARASVLMRNQPVHTIPNCIDTSRYRPHDRMLARQMLGLKASKRYLLFSAIHSTSEVRKGYHLLRDAASMLAQQPNLRADIELLIVGANEPGVSEDLGLPATYIGYLYDELSLSLLYAAADVLMVPSLQDNLPNTIVEALACGTPSVGFAVGGIPDLIKSGSTGFLAAAGDPVDFYRAIVAALQISDCREECRENAERAYSESAVVSAYSAVYSGLVV